jgi:mono/diheme cytochrome c family protein
MTARQTFFAVVALLFATGLLPAASQAASTVTTAPMYVPDITHANDPLPPGVLAWDAMEKSVVATNGQAFAWFAFSFTNVAAKVDASLATNFCRVTNFITTTNHGFWQIASGWKYATRAVVSTNPVVVTITNSVTPLPVAILSAHASCGCTQPQLPPLPWILPPGTNTSFRVSVNLAGKTGELSKTVTFGTDQGKTMISLKVSILPPPPPRPLTDAERARGINTSKIDRQAVFKGDCASCHAKEVEGKYGQRLFAQVCAVCHETANRASMVPDLHNLNVPTSEEFWRTWITSGKAGTLMPAFVNAQGGPLTPMQITSLATYLNATIPSKVQPPAAK